jgi:hypothetical protein
MGAASGALLTFIAQLGNTKRLRSQKDRDSTRVGDLLTVLGAPLFHARDNRPFTTEERVEWIKARVG